VLKEGAAEDGANRDRITKLLRFASTKQGSDEQTVSLAEYVGRMKDGQEAIYYITGDGFAATRNSPHLEIFRKLDVEVLLMYDRVDEWVASMLTEFDGKPLRSVAKGGLDLGKLGEQVVKPDEIAAETEYKPLVERIQRVLAARAREVRVTHRLTDSPACLVTGRTRHEHAPRADVEGRRPERPGHAAGAGDQSAASDRAAPQGRGR
jgi:molecular chaperone HtpG